VTAPDASCSSCTCGVAQGACGGPDLALYAGSLCNTLPMSADVPGVGCIDLIPNLNGGYQSVRGGPPMPALAGSCQALGGAADVRPPAFADAALLCGASVLGHCSSGDVCAPAPADPFRAKLCIAQGGDVACPPGPYTLASTVYASIDDTRGCTSCACSGPQGVDCSGITVFYSDDACTDVLGQATHDGNPNDCSPLAPNQGIGSVEYMPTAPGTCSPGGGAATGSAVPAMPVTVCCLP
jgi:hypothetical protein